MTAAGQPAAVCFDYGGTLVQIGYPERGLKAAGDVVADLLELPPHSEQRPGLGTTLDALVERLVAEAHRSEPLQETDIYRAYQRAIELALGAAPDRLLVREICHLLQLPWRGAVTVDPAAAAAVRQLKRDGARLGLLSNSPYPAHLMREMLAAQGLFPLFDAVVFSSEIGARKPAPAAFTAMLERVGAAAGQSWFVGDEWEADIEGASAAGMTPVLAPRGRGAPCGIRPEVARLGTWAELPERWRHARQSGPPGPASVHFHSHEG